MRNPAWLCAWAHNYDADGWWREARPPISEAALVTYKQWITARPRDPTGGVSTKMLKTVTAAAGLPTRTTALCDKAKSGQKRRDMHRDELVTQLAKIFSELDHELANGRGGSAPLRQRRQRFFTSPAQPARGSPAHQSAMGAPRISAAASGARQPPGAGGGADPDFAAPNIGSSTNNKLRRVHPKHRSAVQLPIVLAATATTSSSSPCPACRSSACRGKCEAPPARATTSSSSPCPACRSSACRGKCEAPPAQRRE